MAHLPCHPTRTSLIDASALHPFRPHPTALCFVSRKVPPFLPSPGRRRQPTVKAWAGPCVSRISSTGGTRRSSPANDVTFTIVLFRSTRPACMQGRTNCRWCTAKVSIRWLQNIVESYRNLGFQVVMSIDGSPITTPSGKKSFIVFIGVPDIRERTWPGASETTLSFRMYCGYVGPSEHWGLVAYTLLCLTYITRSMYGLQLVPRIGSSSDNSDSIIKAVQFVFEGINHSITGEHVCFNFMSASVVHRKGGTGWCIGSR